jgi:hypothetical protein
MKSPRGTLTAALGASADPAIDDTFGAEVADAEADGSRCGVLVRVSPELRRELKLAAIARRTTVQTLMLEAIAIVLKEPGAVFKP